MKKNGYTLIELILTIALLATASTIIIVNMVGLKGNQDQDRQNRFEDSVASAACAYVDTISMVSTRDNIKNNCQNNSTNSICYISLATLVDNSVALVDPDLKDPLTNCTAEKNEEKNNVRVYIHFDKTKVNGQDVYEKKCEFQRIKVEECKK